MRRMNAAIRFAPCLAGLWPLVGTAIVQASPSPTRADVASLTMHDAPAFMATCMLGPGEAARPATSPPAVGDDAFRPTHFTVAPVIVAVERSRAAGMTRRGGLYGP